MNSNKNLYAKLIPVMLCFFAMGFVDLVGIASTHYRYPVKRKKST